MIIWNSYWGKYSRVLKNVYEGDPVDGYIECNLTPVNGLDGNWDEVRYCRIRCHGTSRAKNDVFSEELPKEWFQIIGNCIGSVQRDWLLRTDILPMIDWMKWRMKNNGGTDLFDCAKDGIELPKFLRKN